jgi:hypothetical protein
MQRLRTLIVFLQNGGVLSERAGEIDQLLPHQWMPA